MNQIPMTETKHQKLLEIIRVALQRDKELREANEIGDKFCFVRDRLNKLMEQIEANIQAEQKEEKESAKTVSAEDETLVYVYLFNAHGIDLKSWVKMLSPKGFYEYSVNRPIYLEIAHIETVIKNKQNKAQHAFLIIALGNKDLIQAESSRDSMGHPLAKIREGSLHFNKLISFIHNGHVYTINKEGEIVKNP
jgi:hypothetical protein